MKIRIWRGYHSNSVRGLIESTWNNHDLLVLCPPILNSFEFVSLLPEGVIELCGEWQKSDRQVIMGIERRQPAPAYPSLPVMGLFTSGTSNGVPKLVLYSRENIESSVQGITKLFDSGRIDTIFCYPQAFHTFGLILGYLFSIIKGCEIVTGEGRYGQDHHKVRAKLHSPNILTLGTPTHFRDLIQFAKEQKIQIPKSYSCIIGGSSVSVELWKSLRDTLRIEYPTTGYGATEASPAITHQVLGREPIEDGEIGQLLPHVQILPVTEKGFLLYGKSACLAMIRKNEIEFPKQVMIHDDIVQRADGVWIYRGRYELMLNRGAEKFSLEHLESILRQQLQVESLCLAIPHPRLGQDLGILFESNCKIDLATLKQKIIETLHVHFGRQFDPRGFISVQRLPLNTNGKIDRVQAEKQVLASMEIQLR